MHSPSYSHLPPLTIRAFSHCLMSFTQFPLVTDKFGSEFQGLNNLDAYKEENSRLFLGCLVFALNSWVFQGFQSILLRIEEAKVASLFWYNSSLSKLPLASSGKAKPGQTWKPNFSSCQQNLDQFKSPLTTRLQPFTLLIWSLQTPDLLLIPAHASCIWPSLGTP